MINKFEQKQILPFEVSLVITSKNDLPCLEIRRATTNEIFIKQIISAAFNGQPIIVQPRFTNKIGAINTLLQKGIIYKDNEEFKFNI